MSDLLDRRPGCECCSTVRQFIKRHLDPEDIIANEEDPAEVVEEFDSAHEDGNCGITAAEIREHMKTLPLRPWQIADGD